jgi:arsenite methyltransferase
MNNNCLDWLYSIINVNPLKEGDQTNIGGNTFVLSGGVLRSISAISSAQQQTSDTFGFKWQQVHTYTSDAYETQVRDWLLSRYGNAADDLLNGQVMLDAGCGATVSARMVFGDALKRVKFIGADVSASVDVARQMMSDNGYPAAFIQCDLNMLPLPPQSVDVIFSEGVLHHTDSPRDSLLNLAKLLKSGGTMLFYVYRKKGPIREFTDDYIRDILQELSPKEAWEAVMPLTKLGEALGKLNCEVEIPEDIKLLDIPAGKINIQRLFYWHVFKAFYRPELSLEEMNHINFDWYAPKNSYRQTEQEVRQWCSDAGLDITREVIEEAGITIIAKKR